MTWHSELVLTLSGLESYEGSLCRLYADNRQFETVKDLQSAICKAWSEPFDLMRSSQFVEFGDEPEAIKLKDFLITTI
uniref:Transposase n=1 Tax=Heterorhabditis bacteriophora TaxID=37862 RepID=A0A1I7X8J6_HETBA